MVGLGDVPTLARVFPDLPFLIPSPGLPHHCAWPVPHGIAKCGSNVLFLLFTKKENPSLAVMAASFSLLFPEILAFIHYLCLYPLILSVSSPT